MSLHYSIHSLTPPDLDKTHAPQPFYPIFAEGNSEERYGPGRYNPIVSPNEVDLLQDLLQVSPSVIISATLTGEITSFNKSAEQLFGYLQNEILGKNISELFGGEFSAKSTIESLPAQRRQAWTQIITDPPLVGRKKSGELFALELMLGDRAAGDPLSYFFFVRDLAVQTRQEQRIAELEREVAYLAQHSLLGELATTITHELAQPLTAITNYTAAAGRCWNQGAEAEIGQELLAKANEQAKRAWLIMHRLRKLLQHRDAEFGAGDLREALDEAIELATLGASHHGISILVDGPDEAVMVRMDTVQVQILLANLIRNAVDELRVSGGERKIWISLRIAEGDHAEVSVEDTGPGIAPDVYANIFDPFLTTKPQGLGVGLAVSRRIALAHNGRLAAKNRPEGGAAFRFIIPLLPQ